MKRASWCLSALAFLFVFAAVQEAWARCPRGSRVYRAKNGRRFCCPAGTRGFYRGRTGISCRRVGRRRGRVRTRRKFEYAGRAGSLTFSFNSLQANAAVRRIKKTYFQRKRCLVVGLYGGSARKFRAAAAHINRVISSRGFAQAMALHHRYYRRWEVYRGSTQTILNKLRRYRWKIVVNTFRRTRAYPCYDDKANGHTNAFAQLGVGFVLISKPYLQRASVRELSRTLIHESLHTLRFSHRGLRPWRKRYNNSVPPFVGCVVKHWNRSAYSNARAQARIVSYCVKGGKK